MGVQEMSAQELRLEAVLLDPYSQSRSKQYGGAPVAVRPILAFHSMTYAVSFNAVSTDLHDVVGVGVVLVHLVFIFN